MPRKMRDSGIAWIGEVPEGWKVETGKYRYQVQAGAPFDSQLFSNEKGFPLIRIRDITSGHCETFYNGEYSGDYIVHNEDLLIGMDGDFNVRWWKGGDALLNQRCCRVIVSDKLERKFLSYAIPFHLLRVNELAYSTTVKHLSNGDVYNAKLPIPPRNEMEKIVYFLGEKCAAIDAAVEETKKGIEEYKAWKVSAIVDAVAHGVRNDALRDCGIDWIGKTPFHWNTYRIINLYREVSERGDDSLPILSVSINTGVSDKELSDEEQERVFIRSEDKSKYKRVQPGDLTYNMMRAWQGAFGAVRVNGMVSPAYVVARPKVEMDSRYVEYLLRSPNATREMQRYSRGIADFRLRLYWPEFKNIRIPCPPLEEQREIADYLDAKCVAIDALISENEKLIEDLDLYKRSLIYEYVTGKREVA